MSSARQVAIGWGAVVLACLALSPLAPQLSTGLEACPVKSLSGLPCPSCGATRATLALADWSPLQAMRINPGVTLAWITFLGGGLFALGMAVSGRRIPALPRRLPMTARIAAVALVAANWFYVFKSGI